MVKALGELGAQPCEESARLSASQIVDSTRHCHGRRQTCRTHRLANQTQQPEENSIK